MSFNGKAPYAPDYASYNWVGAPANYDLSTNTDLGGDSRMQFLWPPVRSDLTVVSYRN
jgi:Amt family ammonium transporter